MLGIQKTSYNPSMTMIYLFLLFIFVNQFLLTNSFRLMFHDSDEYEPDDVKRAVFERFGLKSSLLPVNNNDLQSLVKSRVERRFCCMSPLLSGRKRSKRDLTAKQLAQQ